MLQLFCYYYYYYIPTSLTSEELFAVYFIFKVDMTQTWLLEVRIHCSKP